MKKLYLVTRTDEVPYDAYVGMVVVAKSAKEALHIQPHEYTYDTEEQAIWTKPEYLKATCIGTAASGVHGVVFTSWKAG